MVNQHNLIYGIDETINQPKPYRNNSGAMDVYIQDQSTQIVVFPIHEDLNSVTLVETAIVDSPTIKLEAGHNFVATNYLILFEGRRFYYGKVLNVATNTITLDTPIDYAFSTSCYAVRTNVNMAVDGSGTTRVFHVRPPEPLLWDITKIAVYIVDDAAMDDTKFGGIAAITNGVVLRKKDGVYKNLGNIKKNGDLKAIACDLVYATKTGGGGYSMQGICEFAGQNKCGVTLRIDGSLNEEVEILIQDDIDALSSLTIFVVGHVVE